MNTEIKSSDLVLELEEQRTHPAPAVVPQQPIAVTPMDILSRAYQQGASPEVLTQLLQLKKDFEADEARKAFALAMVEFKKNPPEIIKDKKVGYEGKDNQWVGYTHASLGAVCDAVIAGLAAVGISSDWKPKQSNGMVGVTCFLTHALGHKDEGTYIEAGADTSGKKNAIQAVGSTITFLERYTLLAACGLATKDMADDDGRQHKDPAPDWSDVYLEAINAAKDKTELEKAWSTAAGACRRKGDVGRPVYAELKLRVEERLMDEFGQAGAGEKKA